MKYERRIYSPGIFRLFLQVAKVLITGCPESKVLISRCPESKVLNTGCPAPGALNTYNNNDPCSISGGNILRMMPGRSSGDSAMQAAEANSSGEEA